METKTAEAAIEIVEPGILTTIQDLGRVGVGALGVSPAGAADWLSARAANRIVGNPPHAALLETTMTGLTFNALQTMRLAVTGATAQLVVAGGTKPLWHSVRVRAGAEVKISAAERGLRSYIAFFGGLTVPAVLGSASTDVAGGFGGLGRALARADQLTVALRNEEMSEGERAIPKSAIPYWRQPAQLRVLPGPHAGLLGPDDLATLCKQHYRVSPRSSRQGARLEGTPLPGQQRFDVISSGVCAGSVQLSSDGLPIVLLAEHQTTGGYAVPLIVITADLPDAAQLRPGDQVQFISVNRAGAAIALSEKMRALTEAMDEPTAAR